MEPIRLYVEDFYAIAKGEIDFTKFSSALILGHYDDNTEKSNGTGKSSIKESIRWAIFNKTRQANFDDVIRWTADEALVEFEFLYSGTIYKILRRRSRIAKESSVSLFIKAGDKWINDSASTNTETNKKIIELLKIDHNVFLNSIYFKQHDISLFANSTPSDRKEIIKSIMKLDRWDDYQELARDKSKVLKEQIEDLSKIIRDSIDVEKNVISTSTSIEEIKKTIEQYSNSHKIGQNKLHSLLELKKENGMNNLLKQRDELLKKVSDIKNNGKKNQIKQVEINEVLDRKKQEIQKIKQYIIDIEKAISDLDIQITNYKNKNHSYSELEETIVIHRVEKERLKAIINTLDITAAKLDVGQCEVCLSEITSDNLSHIHKDREKKRTETINALNVVVKKLNEIEDEYKQRKNNKEKIDSCLKEKDANLTNLEKFLIRKNGNEAEAKVLEAELSGVNISLNSLIDEIKILKAETEKIEQKISEQKINNMDAEIINIEQQNSFLLSCLTEKNIKLGTLLKEKEFFLKKNELIKIANEDFVKIQKAKTTLDQLVRFFGKEGIQAVFIESVVDELEQYANETLAQICNEPTIIRLKTQKKTESSWQETLEIDIIMNGFHQTFESLSGGEMFRVSLALRIGLSEVLAKKSGGEMKMLLLDEVDSPLDTYGVDNFFENVVKGLEKRYKVLVISHNDRLKDRFDDVIVVNKTSNGSFISQN